MSPWLSELFLGSQSDERLVELARAGHDRAFVAIVQRYRRELYAHARRGMFLTLWNARVGDEVFVSTPAGTALKYVVTEVHPRVSPDDTSWIQPSPAERLTLQTSTGPNRTDPRFVVVAAPV